MVNGILFSPASVWTIITPTSKLELLGSVDDDAIRDRDRGDGQLDEAGWTAVLDGCGVRWRADSDSRRLERAAVRELRAERGLREEGGRLVATR